MPEFRRRQTGGSFKQFGKIVDICNAAVLGDGLHLKFCVGQQLLRHIHPAQGLAILVIPVVETVKFFQRLFAKK